MYQVGSRFKAENLIKTFLILVIQLINFNIATKEGCKKYYAMCKARRQLTLVYFGAYAWALGTDRFGGAGSSSYVVFHNFWKKQLHKFMDDPYMRTINNTQVL